MNFLLSDTFTDSLARLTSDEQKLVKTTVFDLQVNPPNPGDKLHKLDRAKDKRFWSVRVGADLRLIVHRQDDSFLVCYVDHHDKAYSWAERRKLETHPKTGAAQLVEIRETVQEVVRRVEVAAPARPKPLLFRDLTADDILGLGVPSEWVPDVLQANEDLLLDLTDHLPREASEALLELATTGGKPKPPTSPIPVSTPFEHPDAQRRFRIMKNSEELERAFAFPWDKWTIFLHPAQRQTIEKNYSGPARVSGSAGTGKTIVALHRAVHLVRSNPDARVLLTTFSEAMADALRIRVRSLISNEPTLGERLDVDSLEAVALRLYAAHCGKLNLASSDTIRNLLAENANALAFKPSFLWSEWNDVIDAWQLRSWEQYRTAPRLGRKTRLKEQARKDLWNIFEAVNRNLVKQGLMTLQGVYGSLTDKMSDLVRKPYDHVVVDEAQDVGPVQLKFLAAMAGPQPNGLFFAGDLGQRIFQQAFSWKSVGVEVRGRSKTLKINYRTSHQIRAQADKLLGPEVSDVDGNTEERKGTVSVFNGQPPTIREFKSQTEEIEAVVKWLAERVQEGVSPSEIGVFVRSSAELPRAHAALEKAGIPFKSIAEKVALTSGFATAGTMHLAKGLEFRVVAVMACDDEVIPSQARIEGITDDSDLDEVYNTERHLLYVACTRARDFLMVSAANNASEFLKDLTQIRLK
ncbi:MAG TPA: UvrD-helicase domain-containing protein [Fibrobacteria bacterium]|nr:UvrD-helicase domain-containing protein [Fibrobacteria bacterium]